MPDVRGLPGTVPLTTSGLAAVADSLAAQAGLWLAVAGDRPLAGPALAPILGIAGDDPDDPDNGDQPWGTRIASGDGWEAWLHSWEHGQVGELHAHTGDGAIVVLEGSLLEDVPGGRSHVLEPGRVHSFPAGHRHGLAALAGTAVSLHVVARAFSATQPVVRRGGPTHDVRPARPAHPQRRPAAPTRRSR